MLIHHPYFYARGSPAGAGIDRSKLATKGDPAGFPRRRGDRPMRPWLRLRSSLVPPQARG